MEYYRGGHSAFFKVLVMMIQGPELGDFKTAENGIKVTFCLETRAAPLSEVKMTNVLLSSRLTAPSIKPIDQSSSLTASP